MGLELQEKAGQQVRPPRRGRMNYQSPWSWTSGDADIGSEYSTVRNVGKDVLNATARVGLPSFRGGGFPDGVNREVPAKT